MDLGKPNNHQKVPQLIFRELPTLPSASQALHKATRSFSTYLSDAARAGIHRGYQIPKKAVKAGTTTVDVLLTEGEVVYAFPEKNLRAIRRGQATCGEWLRWGLALCFSATLAGLYALASSREPDSSYWSLIVKVGALVYPHLTLTTMTHIAMMYAYVGLSVSVRLAIQARVVYYLVLCPNCDVRKMFGGTFLEESVRWVTGWVTYYGAYFETTQGVLLDQRARLCAWHYFELICPEWHPWYVRAAKYVWTSAVSFVSAAVNWVSPRVWGETLLIFIGVYYILMRLMRSDKTWAMRLTVESQALSVARTQKNRALQEKTADGTAATPYLTHVENHVKTAHPQMPSVERDKYLAVCLLVASALAANRTFTVDATEGEAEPSLLPAIPVDESLGGSGPAKRLLRTRTNTAPPNTWRKSIVVYLRSWFDLHNDIQMGQDRTLPGQDTVKERYSGCVTGPELVDISEGFEGGKDDEIAGVSRHLRKLKSLVTGEYINPKVDEEHEAYLERATDIIIFFLVRRVMDYPLYLYEWALPQKWGASRETWWQRMVEKGREVLEPRLTGFCKLNELALPLTKLPRLVGSMGNLACAKSAAVWCCVEKTFCKFVPQCVVKGKTQSETANRLIGFARRARRMGMQILSIDMSAMDSSWTFGDRQRVGRVMRAIAKQLEELLEAETQKDLVEQCHDKKRKIRWMLKYIQISLAAIDSILFSGERSTSIGNRILILIIWGAEFIRIFGDGDGCERIEKMLYCPPQAYEIRTDERAHGPQEDTPYEDHFPESPYYDCNIGDGDDCAAAIDTDMYESKEAMQLAWEKYHKLVELCSRMSERTDIEVLSTFVIFSGGNADNNYAKSEAYVIPKIARNFQRLLAHKIRITPGAHFASGVNTVVPTPVQYSEIATDMWQRSFNLKHSLCVRQMCRAMFFYTYDRSLKKGTVYDEDKHRLGKIDGDVQLSDCAQDVLTNASMHASTWAMVKASNFLTIDELTAAEVKQHMKEWQEADQRWAELELTDDMCSDVNVFLTSFPVGPSVAKSLGFKPEIQATIHPQLAKADHVSPDVRDGGGTGSDKANVVDPVVIRASSVVVWKPAILVEFDENDNVVDAAKMPYNKSNVLDNIALLTGHEPHGKPRHHVDGFVTLPAGKAEEGESFEEAAIREAAEEACIFFTKDDLTFANKGTAVLLDSKGVAYGTLETQQYLVMHAATAPSVKLTADRLDELRFRTINEIANTYPPERIAECIKQAVKYLCETAGVSSPLEGPSCEVKLGGAEPPRAGPPTAGNLKHAHVCPACDTSFEHEHPHDPKFEHKIRKGDCPNQKCAQFGAKTKQQPGVRTSSKTQEIRQPGSSRSANVYGTSQPLQVAGQVSTPIAGAHALSQQRDTDGKGKGKGRGKGPGKDGKGQSKGKSPPVLHHSAPPGLSSTPWFSPGKPAVPAINAGSTAKSGISGQGQQKPGDGHVNTGGQPGGGKATPLT